MAGKITAWLRLQPSAFAKALFCNVVILMAWYAAEYQQFGELQHGRSGDNIAFILYFALTWHLFAELGRKNQNIHVGNPDCLNRNYYWRWKHQ